MGRTEGSYCYVCAGTETVIARYPARKNVACPACVGVERADAGTLVVNELERICRLFSAPVRWLPEGR
jgi:hypothetical protein